MSDYAVHTQRRRDEADARRDAAMIRYAVSRLEAAYQTLVDAQKYARTREAEEAISEARAGLADLRDELTAAAKKMEG